MTKLEHSQRLYTGLTLWGILILGSSASAQQSPPPASSAATTSANENESKDQAAKKPLTPEEQKRADLRADTEKLYKLTQELKAEVEKSNKDTLSVSVVKKAQEVERLAKSIKERSRAR